MGLAFSFTDGTRLSRSRCLIQLLSFCFFGRNTTAIILPLWRGPRGRRYSIHPTGLYAETKWDFGSPLATVCRPYYRHGQCYRAEEHNSRNTPLAWRRSKRGDTQVEDRERHSHGLPNNHSRSYSFLDPIPVLTFGPS